ncbi:RluA family pseudouridine synthase [Ornithinibacillus sp. 4-3]|uniref:Pseudouridine synthase n=1 Tax=Ornithinibacillus sp. 4-3 TaxID=3231488 RepID=A0AB39HR70_9BACI
MRRIIEAAYDGMMLRDYLQKELHFSRRIIKGLTSTPGNIWINNEPQTVRYTLCVGDRLFIQFPPEERGSVLQPEPIPLTMIYEDDDLMIIDKPAGMATLPSSVHRSGTLANGILAYYDKKHLPFTVHIVTRLDRDTSGIVLIAKHQYSHSLLAKALKEGNVMRKYFAGVEGKLLPKQGTINAPIGRDTRSIIKRLVTEEGKTAISHYQVKQEMGSYSLVEIKLETGRTHQIRVHFSYIGHPLAGDDLYGGTRIDIARQALHCSEISFEHPISKKIMHFRSSNPEDIEKLFM